MTKGRLILTDSFKTDVIPLSHFHQTIIAHELTLKRASIDMRKMEAPLSSAMVDLNPHQIDAGLFAFKGPMSKGAILCDEVGLGKTIEAGLIICQLWAEGKRKIIVVVPASIRKQWQNELLEKFSIPCVIVDGFEYRQAKKNGKKNPFDRNEVVITSIPFASMKSPDVASAGRWDLVVIDEAHRLRNVYKKTGSIQAKKLKEIFTGIPKILLTATPLQNTLMELYGLTSIIDERIFGSEYAFKVKFIADSSGHVANNLELLKERLSSVAIRTIRRQVREYIPYTNRISMLEDFTPTDEELKLYEQVSGYLQRPVAAAIPTKQRHLMILIYRKILASSSFAIAKTLQSLIDNVEKQIKGLHPVSIEDLINDMDGYEEEKEDIAKREDGETVEDDEDGKGKKVVKVAFSLDQLESEKEELLSMKNRAESIHKNAKGDALLMAIEKAFSHARKMGWSEKAVVFTESRRTQEYLLRLFSGNGYKDQITNFNGTNESPIAKRAYALWEQERVRHEGEGMLSKDAVIREALIHEFKHHTKILISTEAGAEGINLQFCNIVINYDLPWNPQRVEQRIGRCHRYGQQNDVVVLNFLNRSNAADKRVFELLDKKFRLFNGVFGASDEILGAIGSGIDFEQRILDIYQSCRTENEINTAFDKLQEELSEQIDQRMLETRAKLLEHFDDEVRARFKVINKKIREDLSAIDMMLASLIISAIGIKEFDLTDGICRLQIDSIPKEIAAQAQEKLLPGQYYIGRYFECSDCERIHLGHSLTNAVIRKIKEMESDKIRFIRLCYSEGDHKISQLEPYIGKNGFWTVYKFVLEGLDTEEHLIHVVLIWDKNEWIILKQELAEKLVNIMAKEKEMINADINTMRVPDDDLIESALVEIGNNLSEKIGVRNEEYYDAELDKLELYAEEVLLRLYDELKEKEADLNEAKKKKQRALNFEERQDARKDIHKLEMSYSHLTDKIAQKKKQLFEEKDREMKGLEKKLKLKVQKTCIAKACYVME
ncbi:MAG: DEAD/DEAH box helicase [Nitrospirae bacterium]|nr:DEAD/DEAH box helicase [Nitrospirota bacterium]